MTTSLGSAIETWGAPTLTGFDTSNPKNGVPLKGSSRQFVRFYPKKFVQVYATKVQINEKLGTTKVLETGTREREYEMVEIVTPGDTNKIDCMAEDWHKREFWKQYKAFRDNKGAMIGKDLDLCDYVAAPVITELKYKGCHTQEQLADCSDELCNLIPEGYLLRNMARSMIKADLENANLGQVNVLKKELEAAQAAIKQLQAAQNEMALPQAMEEEKLVRRPGKPRTEAI